MKVRELIAELQKFPPDAYAYAYEGEITGVIIVGKWQRNADGSSGRPQLGEIECRSDEL